MSLMANSQMIKRSLELFSDGTHNVEILEIEKGKRGPKSAFFSPGNLDAAAQVIATLNEGSLNTSFYVGLNPSNLEAKEHFTTGPRASRYDIIRRRWILIDIDPDRFEGVEGEDTSNATDNEKASIRPTASFVYQLLLQYLPQESIVRADSGNGYHVLIRVDAPIDPTVTNAIRRFLVFIRDQVEAQGLPGKIDLLFDAPRITALYGTIKRKAAPTATRPERVSALFDLHDPVPCLFDTILQLAGPEDVFTGAKEVIPGAADATLNELLPKLEHLGPSVKHQDEPDGATYIVDLRVCPMAEEHSTDDQTGAFVLIYPDGGYCCSCWHSHGAGQNLSAQFRERLGIEGDEGYEELLDELKLPVGTRQEVQAQQIEERKVEETKSLLSGMLRSAGDIISSPRPVPSYIVRDLFRVGESVNVVAPSKAGKTFLVLEMAVSVATGQKFLDVFETNPTKVAIFDNELHGGTFDDRFLRVLEAKGVKNEHVGQCIFVANFRDLRKDPKTRETDISLSRIEPLIAEAASFGCQLIIIDALYRFLPAGIDENDNAGITQFFNMVDGIAQQYGVALVLIHHSSKGEQGSKEVVDVGSGAGAFGRTTDCHVSIRKHVEEDKFVLEARCRSSKSPAAMTIEREHPLWKFDRGTEPILDTAANRKEYERKAQEPQKEQEREAFKTAILNYLEEKKEAKNTDLMMICPFEKEPSEKFVRSFAKELADQGFIRSAKVGRSWVYYPIAPDLEVNGSE